MSAATPSRGGREPPRSEPTLRGRPLRQHPGPRGGLGEATVAIVAIVAAVLHLDDIAHTIVAVGPGVLSKHLIGGVAQGLFKTTVLIQTTKGPGQGQSS
jgi:hypothetical protein